VTDDLDLLDPRCVDHEGPLDADAGGDATHGHPLVQPAAAQSHHGPLEDLDSLATALHHLDRHLHGVAGGDGRDVAAELLALKLLDRIHPVGDLVIAALAADYRLGGAPGTART
jgi:hypothetical protein